MQILAILFFYNIVTESNTQLQNQNEIQSQLYTPNSFAIFSLSIHTTSSLFDRLQADLKIADQKQYPMPDEIVLQLSHKDVNLGFFKPLKKEILALRAGGRLRFDNNYLYSANTTRAVCLLSQKMQADLRVWTERNYHIHDATIRFIVAWLPKDAPKEEKEHAVLLADLTLKKSN